MEEGGRLEKDGNDDVVVVDDGKDDDVDNKEEESMPSLSNFINANSECGALAAILGIHWRVMSAKVAAR